MSGRLGKSGKSGKGVWLVNWECVGWWGGSGSVNGKRGESGMVSEGGGKGGGVDSDGSGQGFEGWIVRVEVEVEVEVEGDSDGRGKWALSE